MNFQESENAYKNSECTLKHDSYSYSRCVIDITVVNEKS